MPPDHPIPDHQLASIFPLLDGQPFQELVDDIRVHGLLEEIVLYEGSILDGRNRYRACIQADVSPRFEPYTGSDPVAFSVSRNMKRRHLSESQRAMVAARLSDLRHGGDRRSDQAANLRLDRPTLRSERVAELLNVSKRSIETARAVRRSAEPEIIAKVDAGKLSISAASTVSRLPIREQREIASKDDDELKAKLKQLREAEARHKAKMATLPTKEEALARSAQTGNSVRANDGKLHTFVPQEERERGDIWFAIKPHVEAIAETVYSPGQFAGSADAFWLPKFPAVIQRALDFLAESKQLMEDRHGASQIAAE